MLIRSISNTSMDSDLENLVIGGRIFSDNMISSGYPENWNLVDVQKIGITNGTPRLDRHKLWMFSNMSYQRTKGMFGSDYEYYLYFESLNGTRIRMFNHDYFGKLNSHEKNLVKIDRLLFYNSSIIKMAVILWN